jgi:hypothetical protein
VAWLALKIQASRQRAVDGKVLIVGSSIARDCRLSWRQVRTVMGRLRDKGLIAYSILREEKEFDVVVALSPATNDSYIRVPYDFVWGGHAAALGGALPTLLALKGAAMGKEPVTNILTKTLVSRARRTERAVKADLNRLTERRHVRECRVGGRLVRLVSLMPVTSEVYGEQHA